MTRIFFDYQYKLNPNLWEYRFYNLLIDELNKKDNFYCFSSNTLDDSMEILNSENFDIFFATGYNKYFISKLKNTKKLAIVIDHMNYELFGNKAIDNIESINKYIQNKTENIFLSTVIFTSNDFSLEILKTLYTPYDPVFSVTNKISNIPLFINFNNLENYKEKPLINKKYILLSNNRDELINFKLYKEFLFKAKEWLIENDIYIVILGIDKTYVDIKYLNLLGIYDRVIYYNIKFDNNVLNNIYRYALCQVCPNAIDGFPYYILEGWNNDCITLLNEENPVFHEIAKGNGLYFSFDTLVEDLEKIKNINKTDYETIIKSQREELQNFSIEKNLPKYIEAFNKISL